MEKLLYIYSVAIGIIIGVVLGVVVGLYIPREPLIVQDKLNECIAANGKFIFWYEAKGLFPMRWMRCELPEQELFDVKL